MDNPVITTENKGIIGNVKIINKQVKVFQKFLEEHSKEVYQIDFQPLFLEDGHIKIEIYFNGSNSQLKEAQKQIDAEQSQPIVEDET